MAEADSKLTDKTNQLPTICCGLQKGIAEKCRDNMLWNVEMFFGSD